MKTFSIKEAVGRGWELFKSHKKLLILSTLIFVLAGFDNKGRGVSGHGGFLLIPWLILFAVAIIVHIGWLKILLKVEDGEHTRLRELFTHLELFWRFLFTHLLFGVMLGVGLVLFIVPGLYVLATYSFASIIVVDTKEGSIWDAFRKSAELAKGKKWKLLGLACVMVLLNILGLIVLGVGVLVSLPVSCLAYVHVYRKLSSKV